MKRIITGGVSALFVAALLGVAGCDGGGGVEPGMPTDVPKEGVDLVKQFDMKTSNTPPPGTDKKSPANKKTPDPGALPAAPDAEKK